MSLDTVRPVDRSDVGIGRADALRARLHEGHWHVSAVGAAAVLMGALCMEPLLDGGWWTTRTVIVVSVIAFMGGLLRSLRVPAPLIPLLQLATLLFTLALLFTGAENRWGVLPGWQSLGRLRELATQGRDYAIATQPPAGPDTGLLLLIVAGVGLAALVVDTLAAGLDLPGMTLIPLAALFLVPWAVQRGSAPWWAFALVSLGWLALLSALQRDRATHWSAGARAGSPGPALAIAVATIAMALLAGTLTTLRGPAEQVDLGTGTGSGGTVRLDAMVSLRRSLISNDTRPVITYATTSARPDYLRTSILELFDGEQWRAVGPNETGPLPPALGDGTIPSDQNPPPGQLSEYQLDVGAFSSVTLPSPRGTFSSLNDWPVVWDQRTSLPLRADGGSVQGARVRLRAAEEGLDADTLRRASRAPARPDQVYPENLADPGPLTGDELPRLAREITAEATNPFDAALALQRWFTTDGGFSYSTQIDGGSSGDALADFLDQRVGYCEQFAATMSLMARSVGIPARVAVGFTQGQREADQWVVRGTDAHAWPELWMGSAGWVRFEPTPGAPTAAAPAYTSTARTAPGQTAAPDGQSAAPTQDPDGTRARVPEEFDAAGGGAGSSGQGNLQRWMVLALLVGSLLLLATVRVVRRRRRTRAADGESVYQEVVDTLVDLRLGRPMATPRSTLAGVADLLGDSDDSAGGGPPPDVLAAVARIQRAVEWQRYGGPGSIGPDPGSGARTPLPAAPGPGPALPQGTDKPGGGVLISERELSPREPTGPDALVGDLRIVRRALATRAGWMRRVVAAAAPPSVTGPLIGRGTDHTSGAAG